MIGSCRFTLSRISEVVEQHGGGLYKRIVNSALDENHKLLKLLWHGRACSTIAPTLAHGRSRPIVPTAAISPTSSFASP